MELRWEVQAFAELMEYKLRLNEHKGGWRKDGTEALMKRLREETDELGDITEMSGAWCSSPPFAALDVVTRNKVAWEAADVANFAMMIADVCGGLPPKARTP